MPRVDLRSRATLIDNLIFAHQVIVASEQLLDFAVHRLAAEPRSGFEAVLLQYFRDHAEEERGHAAWLVRDLATAGATVADQPLSWDAVQAVGAQYYLVLHAHPVALLGYMAALEGMPMPIADVDALEALHGRDLLRTLRFHAEHDVDHCADLCQMLDQVPAELRAAVMRSADSTASHWVRAALQFGKVI